MITTGYFNLKGGKSAQNYTFLHHHEWGNLQVKWHFWQG